jgi:hypothetical protein
VAVLAFTFTASAADFSGKWIPDPAAAAAGGGGGRGRGGGGGTYEFKVAGDKLTGSVTTPARGGGEATVIQLADGKVTGDTFTFSVTRPGFNGGDPMKVTYTGKVDGDKLELSFDTGRGARTTTLVKAP